MPDGFVGARFPNSWLVIDLNDQAAEELDALAARARRALPEAEPLVQGLESHTLVDALQRAGAATLAVWGRWARSAAGTPELLWLASILSVVDGPIPDGSLAIVEAFGLGAGSDARTEVQTTDVVRSLRRVTDADNSSYLLGQYARAGHGVAALLSFLQPKSQHEQALVGVSDSIAATLSIELSPL